MKYTMPVSKDMVSASTTIRASPLHSVKVCRALNRKKFKVARKFVNDLVNEKADIEGKYYTKTSKEIQKFLKMLDANATQRGFTADDMRILISAHQGPTLYRGRRKRNFGLKIKIAHIQAVLKPIEKKKSE
jgi:ribosomal protein L22